MQEINQRYFNNNPPENKKSSESIDKKLKPIIKVLDSSEENKETFKSFKVSSERKENEMVLHLNDEDDRNSLVAMEDEIEMEK